MIVTIDGRPVELPEGTTVLEAVNRLAREWGVTHLVVVKRYLDRERIRARNIYVNPYNDYIAQITRGSGRFVLADPPRANVVYENPELHVVALPLTSPLGR